MLTTSTQPPLTTTTQNTITSNNLVQRKCSPVRAGQDSIRQPADRLIRDMAPASTSKGRGRASAQAQVTSEASDPGQTNDNGQIRLTQSPSPTPSLDPFASLDPELHQQTLNSVGINGTSKADEMSEKEQSRLSDFAQHVLGGSASSIPQHDDAASLLAFSAGDEGLFEGAAQAHQGFTELLDAADRGRRLGDVGEDDIGSPRHEHMTEVMGGDEHQGEDEGEYQLEGQVDTRGEEGHVDPEPPMPGRGPPVSRTFGRKRRREEDRVQVTNNGEDGEPVDPVKMKKDSHVSATSRECLICAAC